MVYISATEMDGRGIYFDTHSVERNGNGVMVRGMVGDGCYEGEVLIEIDRETEVTFVDQWLGDAEAALFLSRCDDDSLRAALVEAALEMPLVRQVRGDGHRDPAPHVYLPLFDGIAYVVEDETDWRTVA